MAGQKPRQHHLIAPGQAGQAVIPCLVQGIGLPATHALNQTGIHIKPRMARQALGGEMCRHAGVLVGRHTAQPQTFIRLVPRTVAAAVAEQVAPRGGIGVLFCDPPDDARWIQKEARVVVQVDHSVIALKKEMRAEFRQARQNSRPLARIFQPDQPGA